MEIQTAHSENFGGSRQMTKVVPSSWGTIMQSALLFVSCIASFFLAGCAGGVIVDVDGLASPEAKTYRSYLILSGKEGVSSSDLEFREYSAQLENALAAQGYVKATSYLSADLAIFVTYGVSDPVTVPYAYSVPIYGQIGGGTTYHSGSIYSSGGGSATYSGNSYQAPQYGVVGSSTHVGQNIFYYRFLQIDAVDLRLYHSAQKMNSVWKTTILSSGPSGDLRFIFPYLVVAGMDHIGTNTKKQISVTVLENDKRLKIIKGELPLEDTQ